MASHSEDFTPPIRRMVSPQSPNVSARVFLCTPEQRTCAHVSPLPKHRRYGYTFTPCRSGRVKIHAERARTPRNKFKAIKRHSTPTPAGAPADASPSATKTECLVNGNCTSKNHSPVLGSPVHSDEIRGEIKLYLSPSSFSTPQRPISMHSQGSTLFSMDSLGPKETSEYLTEQHTPYSCKTRCRLVYD